MKETGVARWAKSLGGHGGIILFFIMAFEVAIMISPFAFFFYSVFNPMFQWLNHYSATKWLTAFFLPHLILPPTPILKTIRVTGSFFFIIGSLTFLVCALQVYLGKILKWGIAAKGLYAYIRHPQYLALGIWGIGMAILWPRFIVLASLSVMFVLYYILARDEEKRMLHQYGDSYAQYIRKTGMFFPKCFGRPFSFISRPIPETSLGYVVVPILIITAILGAGFVCRKLTLNSLDFESRSNITLVSILPEDSSLNASALDGILRSHGDGKMDFLKQDKDYLGYVMPADYIMQGLIADTGSQCHLYKKHHTIAMVTDWVLHPFAHLRRPPSTQMAKMHKVDPAIARRHHCPIGINQPELDCEDCPYRRVVIVEIGHDYGDHISGDKLLSFNTTRIPVGFVDVNTQTGEIVNITKVEATTAWKDVPTPAI